MITILILSDCNSNKSNINTLINKLLETKSPDTYLDIYIHIEDYNKKSIDPLFDMKKIINKKHLLNKKVIFTFLETRYPEIGALITPTIILNSENKQYSYNLLYQIAKTNINIYFAIKKTFNYSNSQCILILEDNYIPTENWCNKIINNAQLLNNNIYINIGGYLFERKELEFFLEHLRLYYLNNTFDNVLKNYCNQNKLNFKEIKDVFLNRESIIFETFENTNKYKNIFLCCKNKNVVPDKVVKNWKSLNIEYDVKLYDDNECIDFLSKEYGNEYSNFFEELPYGPIKADFWRLCILNKYGGIYSDIDIEPLESLTKILENDNDNEITFCSCINFKKNHIFQAFIYSTPNNEILKKCIDVMLSKKHYFFGKNINKYHSKLYWKLSGCYDMYNIITELVGDKLKSNKMYTIKNNNIKLLEEYIPKGSKSVKDCLVKYKDIDLMKSRYSDYNMVKHGFSS
jgi:hypothetical protein